MKTNHRTAQTVALLFPGQGAQDAQMLDGVRKFPRFAERYELICDALGRDPLCEVDRGNRDYLNHNAVSSLLTLLVSTLLLERYRANHEAPAFLAGYSVGQWLALYAANVLSFETMVAVVQQRAQRMDHCFANVDGGMVAVIGLPEARLQQLCADLRAAGHFLAISNYNCVGQFSLAGTTPAIDRALTQLELLKPKKVLRLPVSGAWHCALLNDAATAFGNDLEGIALCPPELPIIDNVTGDFLPTAVPTMKTQLAAHLASPVQWHKGIKRLIVQGGTHFIEVGYGNTLTKFGFFIDRGARHMTVVDALGSCTKETNL